MPNFNDRQEQADAARRSRNSKAKRFAMVGLASIGGGILIGLTGGLAAPLIGAGLASVVGSSAIITAIGTAGGTAIVGSLFGVAGASLTGINYELVNYVIADNIYFKYNF